MGIRQVGKDRGRHRVTTTRKRKHPASFCRVAGCLPNIGEIMIRTAKSKSKYSSGQVQKLLAFDQHEANHPAFLNAACRVFLKLALNGQDVTADAIRDNVALPTEVHPATFGAVPRILARARLIHRIGFAPSTRPESHARPLSVWRLVDGKAADAELWLSNHPASALETE